MENKRDGELVILIRECLNALQNEQEIEKTVNGIKRIIEVSK